MIEDERIEQFIKIATEEYGWVTDESEVSEIYEIVDRVDAEMRDEKRLKEATELVESGQGIVGDI